MPANHLYAPLRCPHCRHTGETEIEVDLDGQGFARDYHPGDRVDWPRDRRPPDGTTTRDGYVECARCHRDYFVRVEVAAHLITAVEVDPTRPGYIPQPE